MDDDQGTIEKVFELIQQGNTSEENSEWWEASDLFCQSHDLLQTLGQPDSSYDGCGNEERNKIRELYMAQAREYRERASRCFIKALEDDVEARRAEPLTVIPDEEAFSRLDLFAHLFSNPALVSQPDKDVNEQQQSLEERFQQLNASLPSVIKSTEERMRDINKGLNRLGLSLYSETNFKMNYPAVSDIEQVEDIIAKARDEVALDATFTVANHDETIPQRTTLVESDDEQSLTSNRSVDEETSIESSLILQVQDDLSEAQLTLAELLALLKQAEHDSTNRNQKTRAIELLTETRRILANVGKQLKGD